MHLWKCLSIWQPLHTAIHRPIHLSIPHAIVLSRVLRERFWSSHIILSVVCPEKDEMTTWSIYTNLMEYIGKLNFLFENSLLGCSSKIFHLHQIQQPIDRPIRANNAAISISYPNPRIQIQLQISPLLQHLLVKRGRLPRPPLSPVRLREVVHGRQRIGMLVAQDAPPLLQHLLVKRGRLPRPPLSPVRLREVVHRSSA